MSFAKLDDLGRRLEAVEHAQSILSVDEAVQMPAGGGERRAEAMAVLAGIYHELATVPEIAEWIGKAEAEPLDEMQRAAVAEFRRVYTNMTCHSAEFVRRQAESKLGAHRSKSVKLDLRLAADGVTLRPCNPPMTPAASIPLTRNHAANERASGSLTAY